MNFSDSVWQLNKQRRIDVGQICSMLEPNTARGLRQLLEFYAREFSPHHVSNCYGQLKRFIVFTGKTSILPSDLINYRASLHRKNEYYLGVLKGFLKRWFELGYFGVSRDIVDLIDSWTLRGNEKGGVVKKMDPSRGPLTDIELQALNLSAAQALESGLISIGDLALCLLATHTGRRPVQLAHLKLQDLPSSPRSGPHSFYYIDIPRAKRKGGVFRQALKRFAINNRLRDLLDEQAGLVVNAVEACLGEFPTVEDRAELPLFPDLPALQKCQSWDEARPLLRGDYFHHKSAFLTKTLRRIVAVAAVHSERTGVPLQINAMRLRYTLGTRAAREGYGKAVIAELLDHSDSQSAGVYVENIPEHVQALDNAVGAQMSVYARAFAGQLIDSEERAARGDDLRSRIRFGGSGMGSCGSYDFCGANVPIPCYTCIHFQPWLDGPHQSVLDSLLSERDRVLRQTGDSQVANANDLSILAVTQVIRECDERRKEIEDE